MRARVRVRACMYVFVRMYNVSISLLLLVCSFGCFFVCLFVHLFVHLFVSMFLCWSDLALLGLSLLACLLACSQYQTCSLNTALCSLRTGRGSRWIRQGDAIASFSSRIGASLMARKGFPMFS